MPVSITATIISPFVDSFTVFPSICEVISSPLLFSGISLSAGFAPICSALPSAGAKSSELFAGADSAFKSMRSSSGGYSPASSA